MSHKSHDGRLIVLLAVLLVLRAGGAWADPTAQIPTREERSLFLDLLNAPDDPVLNLKYGRLAMSQGRLNRAMEAFRRVLVVDPTNADARAAITQIQAMYRAEAAAKPRTDFSFLVGGQYESNAAERDPSFDTFEDTMAKTGFAMRDSRQILGHQIETSAQIYKSLHNRYRAGDVLYLGFDSGPVIDTGTTTWRIAPLVRYARLNTRPLFLSYGVTLRYRRETNDAFKGFDATATYDDYKDIYEPYQGPRFEADLRYLYTGLIEDDDSLSLVPSFAHVNAVGDGGAHRYEGLTMKAAYSRPAFRNTVLTLALTLEGRWYAAKESTEPTSSQRKDFRAEPEVRLTFLDLLPKGGRLETRVNYDANFSNDTDKHYRGYLIGATALWNF